MRILCTALLIGLVLGVAAARAETYQSPEDFLHEVFGAPTPAPGLLWLTGDLRDKAKEILGHEPAQLRLRYWQTGPRTAWVLDEIGKEKPITTGIVVNAGRIERVRVLIFRESRGWEVRHDFFTDQFQQVGLDEKQRLDRPIDGISGATLSVRAVSNLARLALLLHQQTPAADVAP